MNFKARTRLQDAVCRTGAKSGCILTGISEGNRGLRLRILQNQPKSDGGPLIGGFHILHIGDNKHSESLRTLLSEATDAAQVLRVIRQGSPTCVNVVNANILKLEKED